MKEKEQEIKINNLYDEEELEVLLPPYYKVMYVDDYGYKHLATVKDINYLEYLRNRFGLSECQFVPAVTAESIDIL